MSPASLDETGLRVSEVRDGLLQEVPRRDEVGVEDRDELAGSGAQSCLQRARLVADAIFAVKVRDVDAALSPPLHHTCGNELRLIRRIVQDLDVEPVSGPIQLTGRVDQALDDVELVEYGELHRYERVFGERWRLRMAGTSLPGENHHIDEIATHHEEHDEH